MKKNCILCGKKFTTDKKHPYKKYCSTFCCKKHYREIHKEDIKKKQARNYRIRIENESQKEKEHRKIKNNIARRKYYKKHSELEKERSRNRYHGPKGKIYY